MNHPLDEALRSLPRRDGRSDWNDLQNRLTALHPARTPRRSFSRRQILSFSGCCLVLVAGIYGWHKFQDRPETAWKSAHQQAVASDPWADPWVVAAVETSR